MDNLQASQYIWLYFGETFYIDYHCIQFPFFGKRNREYRCVLVSGRVRGQTTNRVIDAQRNLTSQVSDWIVRQYETVRDVSLPPNHGLA